MQMNGAHLNVLQKILSFPCPELGLFFVFVYLRPIFAGSSFIKLSI